MDSTENTLCVCGCERKKMDKAYFDIYREGNYCTKCGNQYSLIPSPIVGILVQTEKANYNEREWISIDELKQLLGEDGTELKKKKEEAKIKNGDT